MNKYDSYKDSGVEWMGEIPRHWSVQRLKNISAIIPSNIDKKTIEGENSVQLCNYVDVYKNEFITDNIEFMVATAASHQIEKLSLLEKDVIATKDSEDPSDIGVPALVLKKLNGVVCGYHLTLLRAFQDKLDGAFLYWLVRSNRTSQYFCVNARGITRYAIGSNVFKNLRVALPPLKEQNAIATYLGERTNEIKALIIKKERLIKLLEEEKIAVINQAVTQGLNPDGPMKYSGVEWIGKIPEHWQIKGLKYIGGVQNGISEAGDYFGSGHPFVTYSDVYKNSVLQSTASGLAKSSEKDQDRFSVKEGDVFFTRTSETVEEIGIASTCFTTIPKATFAGFLIRLRPHENILDKEFSQFYFRSFIPRIFFVKEMNLVTRASLSQELLKRLPVLLPPIEEQKKIGKYISNHNQQANLMMKNIKKEISLLKEYRTALISEVVTGKVDVGEEMLVN